MSVVPGALRRLSRERSRLVAVVLIAGVAVAASGVQSAAALVLRQTIADNWRGAYDILVTAPGATATLDRMLAPNSLASGERMSLDDVARVRALDGVGVAAPIGSILVPALKGSATRIAIPRGATGATQVPQAFRVDVTYSTDDGLGERIVSTSTADIVIDETHPPATFDPSECAPFDLDGITVDPMTYPAIARTICGGGTALSTAQNGVYVPFDGTSWGTADEIDGAWSIQLGDAPIATTRVTLVDPSAERELLGDAGAFLTPLDALAPDRTTRRADLDAWAAADGGTWASGYEDAQDRQAASLSSFGLGAEYEMELRELYAANGRDFDTQFADSDDPPYVPLLVGSTASAALTMSIDVTALGEAPIRAPGAELDGAQLPYAMPDEAQAGIPVGSATVDASADLDPFVLDQTAVAWPGSDFAVADEARSTVLDGIAMLGHVDGSALSLSAEGAVLHAQGYRAGNQLSADGGAFTSDNDPVEPGSEAAYLGFVDAHERTTQAAIVAAPVGDIPDDVAEELQTPASYVPLGAYDTVGSTLADGTEVLPSVSGMGLVSPRTTAIASVYSAATWDDKTPVDAVRVRVSDVGSYSPRAQERVLDVAQRIRALGFDATVVAGSSPSGVDVLVEDYAFGTDDPHGTQRVGDLGTVRQSWSELGAASRADVAVGSATIATLALALGSTAVLLGAVQLVGVPRRRARAAVLREIGFTRGRIARWMGAEELPGLLVVLVAGGLAAWAAGFTRTTVFVSAIAAMVVAGAAVASVIASSTRSAPRRVYRDSASLGAVSAAGFGARQVALHPGTALAQAVGVIVVGVATAGIALAVQQGIAQAGASVIAQLATEQALVAQIALGTATVLAGAALGVITRRVDLARRAAQWRTLRALGWTDRILRRSQRIEAATTLAPAVLVTALLTGGAAALLDADGLLLVPIAVAAASATSLLLVLTRRKATR